jgi:hypothetical protein
MPESPKEVIDKVESINSKKLVLYLIPLFILFIFVGIAVGNLIPRLLKKDENTIDPNQIEKTEKESKEYEGKVVFVDPNFYPNDKISFYLEDSNGEEIILLKTDDQKLTVVEGLSVTVFGEVEKTADGKEEVLMVEKVVVRN